MDLRISEVASLRVWLCTRRLCRIQGLSATPFSRHLAGSRNKHFYSTLDGCWLLIWRGPEFCRNAGYLTYSMHCDGGLASQHSQIWMLSACIGLRFMPWVTATGCKVWATVATPRATIRNNKLVNIVACSQVRSNCFWRVNCRRACKRAWYIWHPLIFLAFCSLVWFNLSFQNHFFCKNEIS